MLFVGSALVVGHTVPHVCLATVNLQIGDRCGPHGQMERDGGAAAVGGDGARAGDKPGGRGFHGRHRKTVGLVRLSLTDFIVDLLRHILRHQNRLRSRRATSRLVGGGHCVGGGLLRRGVDVGLCASRIPLICQAGVDIDRWVVECADRPKTDCPKRIVTTGQIIAKTARIDTPQRGIIRPEIHKVSIIRIFNRATPITIIRQRTSVRGQSAFNIR